jgi:hypothetical protein
MRIIDFFDKGVSDYPNNLAFVEPGSQYTYSAAYRSLREWLSEGVFRPLCAISGRNERWGFTS